MIKVLILGSSGMLGSSMLNNFTKIKNLYNFQLKHTTRKLEKESILFDALNESTFKNILATNPDYIINCIGLIKPHINVKDFTSRLNCLKVNSFFPIKLPEFFSSSKIIHITTDGVFDGEKGNYDEDSETNNQDLYSYSKKLGEVNNFNVMNLRCSIIGYEKNKNYSFLNWFLLNKNEELKGYIDQMWNGLTCDALSKICISIIFKDLFKRGTFHLFTKDVISKYELLCLFNRYLNKNKTIIYKSPSGSKKDLSLSTKYKDFNLSLWRSIGYDDIPPIENFIKELI